MIETLEIGEMAARPGLSHRALHWRFIQSAAQARLAAGGTIDGPDWMKGGRPLA